MSGNAMLTMNRSRLATNTPTDTMAATLVRCMMQRKLPGSLYDATVLGNTYRGQNCSIAGALELLVDEGVLRRERYQERPERFEYRLTRKGVDLWPVLVSLMKWGDKYTAT